MQPHVDARRRWWVAPAVLLDPGATAYDQCQSGGDDPAGQRKRLLRCLYFQRDQCAVIDEGPGSWRLGRDLSRASAARTPEPGVPEGAAGLVP